MNRKLRILIAAVLVVAVTACAKKEAEIWYCPMHKNYQSDHPGECPICGMKLVKKDAAVVLPARDPHAGHKPATEDNPPDKIATIPAETISIASDKQQILGIETAKPKVRTLALALRLPAQVAYEPDLYTAIVEYRQIVNQGSSLPEGISAGGLIGAAKLRVRQLGLGDDELRQFARSETAASRLLTGTGHGQALIALQVSEGEIGLIRVGQKIKITAGAYAGKTYAGRVTGIGTLVDAKRRAFTVRALVTDARGELRAQMFVSAELPLSAGKGLSVPRSAVFNTGQRQVVFVRKSAIEFAPVEVKILGGNNEFSIVSGITDKEEVVVSSAFLFDSEARVKIGDYR